MASGGGGAGASNGPRAASTASRSTRSFIGRREWPLTQRKGSPGRPRYSSISGSHRSRLATGWFWEFFQPRASQPRHQLSRKQLHDVGRVRHHLDRARFGTEVRSASSTAWISMRWLVVWAAPPEPHRSPSGATAHAHPPGPGFPEQAPSVNTIVGGFSGHVSDRTGR